MFFTLGLRHTFHIGQRGLALVQSHFHTVTRFVQGGEVKTSRYVPQSNENRR